MKNTSHPKGTYFTVNGKRYKSLGGGKSEGVPQGFPKMSKVKSAPKTKKTRTGTKNTRRKTTRPK